MTASNSNNIWNIVVPVMVILLIVFIVSIAYLFLSHTKEGSGSYTTLTEINQSIIPEGTIYHLSEKDFEDFPSQARVIRDNSQKPTEYGGKKYYYVSLSEKERTQFISKYPVFVNRTTMESETYFEYNRKYYSFYPLPIL
jgi:hypothetical protein